jgi:Flp pilus assembly protein TadD
MMKSNRALTLARTAQARDYYLGAALDDLDYMVNNSKPGFALLPEVLNFRAETLVRLGFGARAVLDCERAIELKPDYWPPYATLSDFYKSVGEVGKARETLQKGLQSSPNSKALAGRLAALNVGKPPR